MSSMSPRFQRYYLILTLLTAGGATIATTGCTRGGGSGNFLASTAAQTTSSTQTTPGSVTSGVVTTTPPSITSAKYEDKTGHGRASKGDVVHVTFDREIKFKTPTLDATKEFALSVTGDNLGTGATVQADPANVMGALITLGDKANLKIGGAFVTTATKAGAASGINVSKLASGNIVCAKDDCPIAPAVSPLDIDGGAAAGFHDGPNMVIARGAHEAVQLDDGRVLIVGGMKDGKKEDFAEDAELYDPLTGVFTTVSSISGPTKGRMMNGSVTVTRIRHTVTKLQDGTVLITGGYGIDRKGFFGLGSLQKETIADAHLFDPKTNTFTRIGELNYARHSHSATLLNDGRVLISGGYADSFWSREKTLAPFELYDPKTKQFTEEKKWLFFTQGTIEKRMNHAAILTDAGVLLAGGEYWDGGFLHFFGTNTLKIDKGSELFDTKSNSFKQETTLNRARRYAAATTIASHDVVLAGGNDAKGPVDQIELWSPATQKWTLSEKLATPRTNAKLAKDGDRVLVIGGFTLAALGEVKSVEVFDGATKKMTAGYNLKLGRDGCAVTQLSDGRIIVTGGFTGVTKDVIGLDGQATASTEIFSAP